MTPTDTTADTSGAPTGALPWVLGLGTSGRGRLLLAILLGALASGSAVALTATSAWLIVRASEHPPVLHLMVAIVAVRTFGIARGVLRYAERLVGHDAAFRVLGDLRVATVARLARLVPLRARTGLTSGQLLARFVGDVDALADLWVRVVLPYASSALVGIATVALVSALVPSAGAVLAASVVAAAVVAPALSARVAARAQARSAPLRAEYESATLDVLAGAHELTLYGALPDRLAELDRLDAELARAERRGAWAAGAGAALATLAAGAATWFAVWSGAAALHTGTLAPTGLAVVALTPLALHELVGGLAPAAHELPALATAARRLRAVFDEPEPVAEPTEPAVLPEGPFALRLRDLRASWEPGGPELLDGLTLDVPAGACTVLSAPSGWGKSTLAAVLLRLLEPTAGSVELIGRHAAVPLTDLPEDAVRATFAWCAQDAAIFDTTVEANLRIARPDATGNELWAALRAARLDGWVAGLPSGLATLVGEHGSAMSGGQRQRLALARTLLADRPVIVFDEPTEHLDEATAAALAADIVDAARAPEQTTLLLTHRPELFAGATIVSWRREARA